MKNLTKQQLEDSIKGMLDFKQLIKEKGTKEETVKYLIQETQLSKEDCEMAFDFYNGLSEETCKIALDYYKCTCTDACANGHNPNCTCTHPECHCTETKTNY